MSHAYLVLDEEVPQCSCQSAYLIEMVTHPTSPFLSPSSTVHGSVSIRNILQEGVTHIAEMNDVVA